MEMHNKYNGVKVISNAGLRVINHIITHDWADFVGLSNMFDKPTTGDGKRPYTPWLMVDKSLDNAYNGYERTKLFQYRQGGLIVI